MTGEKINNLFFKDRKKATTFGVTLFYSLYLLLIFSFFAFSISVFMHSRDVFASGLLLVLSASALGLTYAKYTWVDKVELRSTGDSQYHFSYVSLLSLVNKRTVHVSVKQANRIEIVGSSVVIHGNIKREGYYPESEKLSTYSIPLYILGKCDYLVLFN